MFVIIAIIVSLTADTASLNNKDIASLTKEKFKTEEACNEFLKSDKMNEYKEAIVGVFKEGVIGKDINVRYECRQEEAKKKSQ